jgi:hypothetical protein
MFKRARPEATKAPPVLPPKPPKPPKLWVLRDTETVFTAPDGRTIPITFLWEVFKQLEASQWDLMERGYVVRRFAEYLGVKKEPHNESPPPPNG